MAYKLPTSFYLFISCVLIIANVHIYTDILTTPTLKVSVFEVGKGRATLIRTQDKKTILIDTGSDASILRALGETLSPFERSIDAVILTSDSTKQTGGLDSLLARYRVGTIIRFGTSDSPPYGSRFLLSPDTPLTIVASGIYLLNDLPFKTKSP